MTTSGTNETVVRGPWKPGRPAPLPQREGGRWKWVPFDRCEDIPADDWWPDTHIPCGMCGPYCEGPDCLCREKA